VKEPIRWPADAQRAEVFSLLWNWRRSHSAHQAQWTF
jgi:hypothetical protein